MIKPVDSVVITIPNFREIISAFGRTRAGLETESTTSGNLFAANADLYRSRFSRNDFHPSGHFSHPPLYDCTAVAARHTCDLFADTCASAVIEWKRCGSTAWAEDWMIRSPDLYWKPRASDVVRMIHRWRRQAGVMHGCMMDFSPFPNFVADVSRFSNSFILLANSQYRQNNPLTRDFYWKSEIFDANKIIHFGEGTRQIKTCMYRYIANFFAIFFIFKLSVSPLW